MSIPDIFEKHNRMRVKADERTAVFKEFLKLSEFDRGYENIPSKEEREKYEELSKEISNSLFWMQMQLTQVNEWLKFEEAETTWERDQDVINKLRNIRDALPYAQARWSGEKK